MRPYVPRQKYGNVSIHKTLDDMLCSDAAFQWEKGLSAREIAREHMVDTSEIHRLLHLANNRCPLTRKLPLGE